MASLRNTVLALISLFSALPAFSADKVRLVLNWKPEPEFGGFYDALDEGLFAQRGLDVEIIPSGSGQPVAQMVGAQKAEFGISAADEVIVSRAKGEDDVALFAVYQTNPQGIMVHESSGIKSLADIFKSGVTLAMERGLPYTSFLEKKYGFSKVKIVPYPGGIGSFLHDKNFAQQCYVTSEPISARRAHSDPKSFLISDSGYNPYTTVLITNGALIAKNKDLVRRFTEAVREGWQHYLKSPTHTNQVMFKLNDSLDLQTYEDAARIQKPLIETKQSKGPRVGKMTLKRWKDLISQLLELKVIDHTPKAEECFREF